MACVVGLRFGDGWTAGHTTMFVPTIVIMILAAGLNRLTGIVEQRVAR